MTEIVKEIDNHELFVSGEMVSGSGWQVVKSQDKSARKVTTKICIQDDGSGYLVLIESHDKSIFADHWFEDLESALEFCSDEYRVIQW